MMIGAESLLKIRMESARGDSGKKLLDHSGKADKLGLP